MERSDINTEIKKKLKKQYESLNPVELKKQIVKLQNYLFKIVENNPFYRERIKEKREKIKECVGVYFSRQKICRIRQRVVAEMSQWIIILYRSLLDTTGGRVRQMKLLYIKGFGKFYFFIAKVNLSF